MAGSTSFTDTPKTRQQKLFQNVSRIFGNSARIFGYSLVLLSMLLSVLLAGGIGFVLADEKKSAIQLESDSSPSPKIANIQLESDSSPSPKTGADKSKAAPVITTEIKSKSAIQLESNPSPKTANIQLESDSSPSPKIANIQLESNPSPSSKTATQSKSKAAPAITTRTKPNPANTKLNTKLNTKSTPTSVEDATEESVSMTEISKKELFTHVSKKQIEKQLAEAGETEILKHVDHSIQSNNIQSIQNSENTISKDKLLTTVNPTRHNTGSEFLGGEEGGEEREEEEEWDNLDEDDEEGESVIEAGITGSCVNHADYDKTNYGRASFYRCQGPRMGAGPYTAVKCDACVGGRGEDEAGTPVYVCTSGEKKKVEGCAKCCAPSKDTWTELVRNAKPDFKLFPTAQKISQDSQTTKICDDFNKNDKQQKLYFALSVVCSAGRLSDTEWDMFIKGDCVTNQDAVVGSDAARGCADRADEIIRWKDAIDMLKNDPAWVNVVGETPSSATEPDPQTLNIDESSALESTSVTTESTSKTSSSQKSTQKINVNNNNHNNNNKLPMTAKPSHIIDPQFLEEEEQKQVAKQVGNEGGYDMKGDREHEHNKGDEHHEHQEDIPRFVPKKQNRLLRKEDKNEYEEEEEDEEDETEGGAENNFNYEDEKRGKSEIINGVRKNVDTKSALEVGVDGGVRRKMDGNYAIAQPMAAGKHMIPHSQIRDEKQAVPHSQLTDLKQMIPHLQPTNEKQAVVDAQTTVVDAQNTNMISQSHQITQIDVVGGVMDEHLGVHQPDAIMKGDVSSAEVKAAAGEGEIAEVNAEVKGVVAKEGSTEDANLR